MYYYKDTRNDTLNSGLVSIQFQDSGAISINSNVPVIDDVGLSGTPYEFTIKNTSSVPIDVNIKLNIKPTTTFTTNEYGAVRYGLYINNELVKKDYINSDNLTLYTQENIAKNVTITCKLYVWVDYYYETPGKIFAANIVAEGKSRDIIYTPTGADNLIQKVNIPATAPTEEQTCDGTEDGLIAINTDGGLALTGDTIREYRYSGGENCVKNYIWFNNENWRIVGIFDGKIKIVKDTPIESAPATYTNKNNDPAFVLQNKTETWAEVQVSLMYWNKDGGIRANLNDWSEAGLMYYLNEENSLASNSYYDTMDSNYKGFIDENTVYYLGNVEWNAVTSSQAYTQERNTSSSNLWTENDPTWIGKIGLMYPSDYGYALDPTVWNGTTTTIYNYGDMENIKIRNWILKSNDSDGFYWLISPIHSCSDCVLSWTWNGSLFPNHVYNTGFGFSNGVRPTLYLKSNTKIISGTGASGDPYRLIADN